MRDVLTQEHKKIEKELAQKRQQKLQQAKKDSGDKTDSTLKGYTVKINNYGTFLSIIGIGYSTIKHALTNMSFISIFRMGPV